MIPKIAHFHWTGKNMNWLRLMSIATFKRHNPGWEIRLHDTPDDIRKHGLMHCQEADWTWWVKLKEHGGLQVSTDIVFLKPIPEHWLKYDLVACMNGSETVQNNAAFAASPGHPYVKICVEMCEAIGADKTVTDFQAFGPSLTATGFRYNFSSTKFLDMPMEAFCSVDWTKCERFWTDNLEYSSRAIGVHWYGGSTKAKELEDSTNQSSGYPVVDLVNKAMG